MSSDANAYSPQWFDFFLRTISANQTEKEVEFLCCQLPSQPFRTVLDVCCGEGRHAVPLSRRGYRVTGVDRDQAAFTTAPASNEKSLRLVRCDMRDLASLNAEFDAAICMWQSFGYFDDATNTAVLRAIAGLLRPAGRFVLDVLHREFFENVPAVREFEKNGIRIVEEKRMIGNRQTVTLTYPPPRAADVFEWRLYTPEELKALGESCGLRTLVACSNFDESIPASSASHRMQIVFERA